MERQVQIKFDLDNAQFSENPNQGISEVLLELLNRISCDNYLEGKFNDIRDINGNTIGQFKITIS